MDKGAWRAIVHRITELDTAKPLSPAESKAVVLPPTSWVQRVLGYYWFMTGATDLQRVGSWAGKTTKQEEIR